MRHYNVIEYKEFYKELHNDTLIIYEKLGYKDYGDHFEWFDLNTNQWFIRIFIGLGRKVFLDYAVGFITI